MLRRLSGNIHQVLTGVSLRQGSYEVGRVETTLVTFRALTDEEIAWYVASGEGRDKAGGYAIQGLASRFIPESPGRTQTSSAFPWRAWTSCCPGCAMGIAKRLKILRIDGRAVPCVRVRVRLS